MRSRLPALVVLLLAALLLTGTLGSADVRAGWDDWRHLAALEGDVRVLDGPAELRSQPAVVALGDGRVLLWGGRGVSADSGVVHDPRTGAWEDLPPAPGPVRFAAATAWTGREAVIWGGSTRSDGFDLDPGGVAYDPATGRWRVLPRAPVGLIGARAYALDGGLLVTGGEQQQYPSTTVSLWLDDQTGAWTEIPAPVVTVSGVVTAGRLVATGPAATTPGRQPASAWPVVAFDPATLTWGPFADPVRTEWAALTAGADGTLWAVTLEGLDEPLRASEWTGSAWVPVAETRRGAEGIVTIEYVGYPPVEAVVDGRLLLGGEGALTSWDPATRRFAHVVDERIRTFGGSARWTGEHLVALSNQASEGWVWTPR